MVDNSELSQRIEKLEKQVELLQAEITAIKNIEVSEKAREQIDKMERANKLVNLMESLSGEKLPDAQKNEELEVLRNISQQAEIEVQSSIGEIEEFIDNSADESDFEWQPYQDGVEITKYVGFSEETVIIPELINNLPVRKIGDKVFLNCKEIYYILLPKTIVELGESVFEGSGLKKIKIPDNIKEIPYKSFYLCENLDKIQLSKQLTKIGSYAFSICRNLSKIQLPNTLNIIESNALQWTAVTNVTFPNADIKFGKNVLSNDHGTSSNHQLIKVAFYGKSDVFNGGTSVYDHSFANGLYNCDFVFYCLPGSSAQQYARENNIPVKHLSEFEKDMQEEK